MGCKECGTSSEVAHRLSCPTLKQPGPPPTLAEACEVIEALLKEWGPYDRIGADGCERARAFLARVKSGT